MGHQYQVVGRHLPTESDPSPSLYRMKVWAVDEVCARSKFWYFIKRIKRVKKANGQIIAVNEIFEKDPTTVKNYGVWLRVCHGLLRCLRIANTTFCGRGVFSSNVL